MRSSSDRAVEATLAVRRIPEGRLEDPDEVDVDRDIDDRALWAVSGICTHQGCVLQLGQPARCLRCPCHSAAFWFDGTLITSNIAPAPGPLPLLPSRRCEGQIELLLPRPDVGVGHPIRESGDASNAP